jgi:hypothetical protein
MIMKTDINDPSLSTQRKLSLEKRGLLLGFILYLKRLIGR